MKRAALILAALAAILTAAAAPVRTATENFVANKIAEAVAPVAAQVETNAANIAANATEAANAASAATAAQQTANSALAGATEAYNRATAVGNGAATKTALAAAALAATNYTNSAVAAIPSPDYSTGNTQLVATIQASAPAPGDYANVSNKAMNAIQTAGGALGQTIYGGLTLDNDGWSPDPFLRMRDTQEDSFLNFDYQFDAWRTGTDVYDCYPAIWDRLHNIHYFFPTQEGTLALTSDIPNVPEWAMAASKPTYTASEVGATTPADVTAAIREQSLGGIWDEALQVWWTPRMRNGSLTYEATTNVNLNAEN